MVMRCTCSAFPHAPKQDRWPGVLRKKGSNDQRDCCEWENAESSTQKPTRRCSVSSSSLTSAFVAPLLDHPFPCASIRVLQHLTVLHSDVHLHHRLCKPVKAWRHLNMTYLWKSQCKLAQSARGMRLLRCSTAMLCLKGQPAAVTNVVTLYLYGLL
eukprot:2414361-Rhodomonas_salina.1